MRKLFYGAVALAALIALPVFAADDHGKADKEKTHKREKHAEAPANPVEKAICVLSATEGNAVSGWVKFTKQKDGVLVEAEVKGLKPNAKHGFHIHEFGDLSAADGTATGGHFNPGGHEHAGPDAEGRHAGDLGNIETDAEGVGRYSYLDKEIRLMGRENNIIGRGIIVHADPDDLSSQPTGNAGARIAQGVIGVAKTE